MIERIRGLSGSRRGSVLALVAVLLPATLGTMALAIDLGMLFQSRVQAQRAADAGALAGASAFRDMPNDPIPAIEAEAEQRARDWAAANNIRGIPVDPINEVHVEVRSAENEVYVHVRRDDIPTWFARFLGISTGNVSADATAQARTAGGVKCLKPLAIPDYWDENDPTQDVNGNNIWDHDESWTFDPGDVYNPVGGGATPETGFGSDFRNPWSSPVENDYGTQLILRLPQGNPDPTEAGWFYPLSLPDPDAGGGANKFRTHIKSCAPGTFFVGDTLINEPGAMDGADPAFQDLLEADPFSFWDPTANDITNSAYSDYTENPRVVLIAIFDPSTIPDVKGRSIVIPTNFAYYFLEGWRRQDGTICTTGKNCGDNGKYKAPIVGRFMFYAQGIGSEGETGPLVLQIRLIE